MTDAPFTVDYTHLESSIERACELIDDLRAQRAELLAAAKDAVAALGGIHSDNVPDSVRDAIQHAEGKS